MTNRRLDRIEQQLDNLITMCKGLMKKMEKNNETMKANNAKLYILTTKYDDCSADNYDEFHFSKQPQMVLPPYPTTTGFSANQRCRQPYQIDISITLISSKPIFS